MAVRSTKHSKTTEVNGYTVQSAPIVMPIETPGYSAQAPLTGYTSLTEYMEAGVVYVHAGCRGRDAGAPAGVRLPIWTVQMKPMNG